MKLGFEESQSSYSSGSQNARAWTETWVSTWAYCPHCGASKISPFPNNSPLADFFCASCREEPASDCLCRDAHHARRMAISPAFCCSCWRQIALRGL
jgi:hypothetical protein